MSDAVDNVKRWLVRHASAELAERLVRELAEPSTRRECAAKLIDRLVRRAVPAVIEAGYPSRARTLRELAPLVDAETCVRAFEASVFSRDDELENHRITGRRAFPPRGMASLQLALMDLRRSFEGEPIDAVLGRVFYPNGSLTMAFIRLEGDDSSAPAASAIQSALEEG